MTSAYDSLLVDLVAEHDALAAVVARLDPGQLLAATPADGWDVRDTLAHLAGFDEAATSALVDPDGFSAEVERVFAEGDDPIVGYTTRGRSMDAASVVTWWRTAREELVAAAAAADPKVRVPWYGLAMSAMSFMTARLMETWAHGIDVLDAVGAPVVGSPRLRHIAHIGVGARRYSYAARGLEMPETPVAVVLSAPDGTSWTWGDLDAPSRVEGSAVDFCLIVTQRRHLDDTSLTVVGDAGIEWMSIAQAFAGGPTAGRAPLT